MEPGAESWKREEGRGKLSSVQAFGSRPIKKLFSLTPEYFLRSTALLAHMRT